MSWPPASITTTYGRAQRGPYVVVIDAGGHDIDQDFVCGDGRRGNDLALPGVARLAETVLPHHKGVHLLRNDAQRWRFSERAKIHNTGFHVFLLEGWII